MFRRSTRAERGTFMRLDLPLQNKTAQTFGRFFDVMIREAKSFLRVERRVCLVQTQTALWNFAEAAPFARHDLENFAHQLLRRLITLAPHRAAILIFHLGAAGFELL